jgi:hypothetical protein
VGESLGGALSAGLVRFPWIGGVLVVSVWAVAIRMTRSDHTRVIRGLVAAALLSGGVFPLLHNIDPHSPFGAWILERFDILTLALTAPVLAVTLAHLCGRLSGPSRVRFGLALCAALLVVRQLLMTAWNGVPSDSDEVEQYAIDLLHTPEPDRQAIVFGTDDHRVFPVLFAREVLGEGSHVLYIDASMLAYPWYRAHLRRQFPHLPDVDKPLRLMDALWRDPQLHDTPIYLANVFSRPSSKLPRVPEGILWRVLPPHALAIGAQEVLARHRAALGRYGPRSPGEEPLPGHPFAGDLAQAYTEGSTMLAEALRAEGDTAP